jgi:hypothetical protein
MLQKMKKTLFIAAFSMLFVMCKTTKTATASADKAKPEVVHTDNFRAAPDAEKAAYLKELNATAEKYSVVVLTKNFKGEQITVTNGAKKAYSDYPISNLQSGLADKTRIDNTVDTKVYDGYTKKEAVISSSEAKKYKFIYVEKKPGAKNPFVITYSNKLMATVK